jgi:hypothetical protein
MRTQVWYVKTGRRITREQWPSFSLCPLTVIGESFTFCSIRFLRSQDSGFVVSYVLNNKRYTPGLIVQKGYDGSRPEHVSLDLYLVKVDDREVIKSSGLPQWPIPSVASNPALILQGNGDIRNPSSLATLLATMIDR